MSRMSGKPIEVERMSKLMHQIVEALPIIRFLLLDGRVIEGAVRRQSSGNNAGAGGRWLYYGNVDIETLDRQSVNVDLYEVSDIEGIWAERGKEYEAAGLIHIVR